MKHLWILLLAILPSIAIGQVGPAQHQVYGDFSDGVIDSGTGAEVTVRGLWDAENIALDDRGDIKERLGTAQIGNTISGARRILGLHSYFKYSTSVYYPMMVFNNDLYILSGSTWTAQSQSLTADLEAGFVDAFDKVYINNGTDSTRIYDGSSVTTDASFKKGTIMAFFENRIIVAIGNDMWYSDLATTTFQTTSYVNLERKITGLLAGDYYLYVFTDHDTYRIARFENYDGLVYGPDAVEKMACHVGTVAHRSLTKIKEHIYTLTANGVYRIEFGGTQATRISEEMEGTWDGIDADYLSGASGISFDDKYFLSIREDSQSYNNKILVFDSQLLHRAPSGSITPAFYPYTYVGATLYPEVLAVIPTSTGDPRLMFGDGITGRVFQMETGTNDNSSAIISYAEKPLLAETRPDLAKRLMVVQLTAETLGAYDILVAFRNDEYSGYSDEQLDLTAQNDTWGDEPWGTFIWGSQTSKRLWREPDDEGYFFYCRIKNDQADEPWSISRIGCMFRTKDRYQPIRR